MKTFLFSALAGLLLFFVASCNNDNQNARDNDDYDNNSNSKTKKPNRSLVGKWEPIDMESEEMTEEDKRDILENASIEFTRDGRYHSVSSDKRESGDYTYDERDRLLTTITESGRKEELKISWVKDKLVMTLIEGGGKVAGKVTMRRVGSKQRNDDDDRDTDDADDYASGSSIKGKWRVINMGKPLTEVEEDYMNSKTIDFRSNGRYVATLGEEGDEHGTYTYDRSAKTLETISESGDREDFDVEFRGKNKIILTYDKGKITLSRN